LRSAAISDATIKREVIMIGSGDTVYGALVSGDFVMLGIEKKA
jgi:hypothetical protein